ncbi:Ff.00g110240.m01.CDS01 [Fusarium sp. VM40]|nr:Ff.00g110240.m01.CDS01 [Fusarium sp. VM40]
MAESKVFAVQLDEVNEEEFELRIKAHGKKQHRNFTGYDQQKPAVVYGYRHATVHGSFIDGQDQPQDGSLIILDWHFLPRDPRKRFKFVGINVVFQGPEGCSAWDEPAVYQMAPRGSFSLHKTSYTEERKRDLEASLGAEFGGSASLKGVYGLSKSTTIGDKIRITGQPYLDLSTGAERDPDKCNAIEWNFFENESQRSGLPTYVRIAILLSRETDDEFTAAFTIRAKVGMFTDMETKLRRVLGRKDGDDPIVFVPSMKEKTAFDSKSHELHKVDLLDQCIFVMDVDVPGDSGEKEVEEPERPEGGSEAGVSLEVSI